jgi:hypothetical protein
LRERKGASGNDKHRRKEQPRWNCSEPPRAH